MRKQFVTGLRYFWEGGESGHKVLLRSINHGDKVLEEYHRQIRLAQTVGFVIVEEVTERDGGLRCNLRYPPDGSSYTFYYYAPQEKVATK